MKIQKETRTYRLTGTTPLLGSCPANPEIYSKFVAIKTEELVKAGIATKEAAEARAAQETGMLPSDEDLKDIKEQGLTVFLRNGRGQLVVGSHVIKGFFKAALVTLKDQVGLAQAKSKIDNLLFVSPEFIPILQDGEPLTQPDGYNERSLRAETMRGPRVSLVSSEEVIAPWTLDVTLTLLVNEEKAKSRAVDWDMIEVALDYGALKGLGQWRNSGKGSFTWERLG